MKKRRKQFLALCLAMITLCTAIPANASGLVQDNTKTWQKKKNTDLVTLSSEQSDSVIGDLVIPPDSSPENEQGTISVIKGYEYIKDTDGIDPGSEYAIMHDTGSQNRVLFCNGTEANIFTGTVAENKFTPSTTWTVGTQVWKVLSVSGNDYRLQSTYEQAKHYYLDLTVESGNHVKTPLSTNEGEAPVVRITQDAGSYKIQGISGNGTNQYYLNYASSCWKTNSTTGVQLSFYKKSPIIEYVSKDEVWDVVEENLGTGINIMFNNSGDNTWVFLGGADVAGGFEQTDGARNYVGHYEEYIRWTKRTNVDSRQRYMINTGKNGRTLTEIMEKWDQLVTINHPRAVSYFLGEEDYGQGLDALEQFGQKLTDYITSVLSLKNNTGIAVIQLPYKVEDSNSNALIEAYIEKVKEVISVSFNASDKCSRIKLVDHYTATKNKEDWVIAYLSGGKLNSNGHLEIGRQLSEQTIGTTDNYPNGRAGSSLKTDAYSTPELFSDKKPGITVSTNSIQISLSEDIINDWGSQWIYKLTTTSPEGQVTTISNNINVQEDGTFTVVQLTEGDTFMLQLRNEAETVQLATMEGIVGGTVSDQNLAIHREDASEAEKKLASLMATDEPLRWLFVGDSITHGANFTDGYAGVAQLFEKYVRDFLGRSEDTIINTAVAGAITADNTSNTGADLRLGYDADVVMIMLGTNDAATEGHKTKEQFISNFNTLLTKIEERNPDSLIVVRIPVYTWHQGRREHLIPMIEAMKEIALQETSDGDKKVDFLIDQFLPSTYALAGFSWLTGADRIYLDNVHPNELGHIFMFRQLVKGLGLWDNDSAMSHLIYDTVGTTVEEQYVGIISTLTENEEKDSLSLDVNALIEKVSDLGSVTLKAINQKTGERREVTANRKVYISNANDPANVSINIAWEEGKKLTLKGLEEGEVYYIQLRGWSVSSAKEIFIDADWVMGEGGSQDIPAHTHSEAPYIKGYTLVEPDGNSTLTTLDSDKYYLIVTVGEDNKVYALYGNQEGVGAAPGKILETSVGGTITAELRNTMTEPTAVWVKDGKTTLDFTNDLDFGITEGTEENAGKYAFRSANGYYLNLDTSMFQTSPNFVNVSVAADADTNITTSRYLHFNVQGEQTVNGQSNSAHGHKTNFWGPTSNPDTYNIYLYAKDDSFVQGADLRGLRKEVEEATAAGYVQADYTANSWRLYKEALVYAEGFLQNSEEAIPVERQGEVDEARDRLAQARAGLNQKPVYVKPVTYEYRLFTKNTSEIKAGDVFAIYSNSTDNRILHVPEGDMTDKVQASLSADGQVLTLSTGNTFSLEQQLWEVTKAEEGNFVLRNIDENGKRYLDLTRASGNKVYLTNDAKEIKIAKGEQEGTYTISSAEDNGLSLTYQGSSFLTSAEATPVRLFERKELVAEIADPNPPTGKTENQPLEAQTGGSQNFRIPSLITLSDGTILAAADARWNHAMDFSAIDIIMSRSEDDGKTWEYDFPIYFNDSTNARHDRATTFIDPVMVRDKNDKIYLVADVFPASVAFAYAPFGPEKASGFVEIQGKRRLVLYTSPDPAKQDGNNYSYYVGDYASDEAGLAPVYEVVGENEYSNEAVFYMDKKFNLYDADKEPMYCNQLNSSKLVQQNVFYWNSLLHVRCAMYLYFVSSEDGGRTWSDPMLLNPYVRKEDGNQSFYGVGPGAGLWLDNGTKDGMVIIPTYTATQASDQRCQFIYSEDGGATWKRSQDSTTDFWSGENCLVQIDDTTVRHFYRSGVARLQYTDHTLVNGSWQAGEPVTMNDIIRTSNNQISALNYSKTIEGEKVIIYSTAKTNGGDRRNGTIYVFTIDADTKEMKLAAEYDITPGEEEYFAYSSIAELEDGSLGILYESQGSAITYKKILMSDIAPEITFDEKEDSDVSDNDPGVSDNDPGVSDNDPGVSDNDPGVSDNDPGVSDNDPGVSDNDTEKFYENIWVDGLEDKEYTGVKVTQKLKVYDGDQLLMENADYTITYKNNINAYEFSEEDIAGFEAALKQNPKTKGFGNFVASKAPQVVIKMKGNYTGSKSIYFQIKKQNIADLESFTIDDLTVTNTGKKQSPLPTVIWNKNGKSLKNKKEFTVVEYANKGFFTSPSEDPLGHILTVKGEGNFTGERTIRLVITPDKNVISMAQAKVSGIKAQDYTGEEIQPTGFTVKYKKTVLTEGTDFEVTYENNTGAGTGYMILTAKDTTKDGYTFVGSKRVAFKINGYNMAKVKATGLTAQIFTGNDIEPLSVIDAKGNPVVTLKLPGTKALSERTLTPDDYEVVYEKNVVKGTASVILTGKPERGITGSKKLTFKIGAAQLTVAEGGQFITALTSDVSGNECIVYHTKGGAKPAVTIVKDNDILLVEGRDYTVSYKANKTPGNAQAVIKGKGNYSGSITLNYTIIKKPVSEQDGNGVWIVVNDKVASQKKNSWKQSFKIWDADGKVLNAKDADLKNAKYSIYDLPADYTGDLKVGDSLTSPTTILPVGTKVQIRVAMTGNYEGETVGIYRIIKDGYDISKAKIQLNPKQYTGEKVGIESNADFKKRDLKGTTLSLEVGEGQNMEVVEGSYINNLKKGTAKVTFRGTGEYGGIKTVTFKIGARSVADWFDETFEYWK